MSRGRTIAPAIVRRAEMRAPLKDLARNSDVGLAGVVAVAFRPATRIFRNATRFRRVGLVLGREPIAGPLPDIADHVVDAVAVRREGRHRRRAPKAGFAFWCGKSPCQVFAIARLRGMNSSPQANSVSSSPPRAANSHSASVGNSFPAQRAYRCASEIGDVHHRMLVEALDVAVGAVRVLPVRTLEKGPPLTPVAQSQPDVWGGVKTSEPANNISGSAPG